MTSLARFDAIRMTFLLLRLISLQLLWWILRSIFWISYYSKGQLISKGLFVILNSSKKRTNEFAFCTQTARRFVTQNAVKQKNEFVRSFFGRIQWDILKLIGLYYYGFILHLFRTLDSSNSTWSLICKICF